MTNPFNKIIVYKKRLIKIRKMLEDDTGDEEKQNKIDILDKEIKTVKEYEKAFLLSIQSRMEAIESYSHQRNSCKIM